MDSDSIASRLLHVERAQADLRVEVGSLKISLHDQQVSIADIKRDTVEIVELLHGMKMLSRILKVFVVLGGGSLLAWIAGKLTKLF